MPTHSERDNCKCRFGNFLEWENCREPYKGRNFSLCDDRGAAIKDKGQNRGVNQPELIKMGPNKVQERGVNLGLLGDDGALGTECISPNKEDHERTSMDYSLTGVVNHIAEVNLF